MPLRADGGSEDVGDCPVDWASLLVRSTLQVTVEAHIAWQLESLVLRAKGRSEEHKSELQSR